jgi:ribose/xylose/arabinose/galactoside ABC-type transport system permease subunit
LYYITATGAKLSVFGGSDSFFGTIVADFVIAFINPGKLALGWMAYWTQLIGSVIIVASVAMQAVLRRIQPGG